MGFEITKITPSLGLGEGPHWDEATQALYFVDIKNSTIHKYVPDSNRHTFTKIKIEDSPKPVSLIVPVKNKPNEFVITYGIDVASITWDGESEITNFQILTSANEEPLNTRINDGKVSPSGILLAGTMIHPLETTSINEIPRIGNFYTFKNFQSKRLLSDVAISNGLAWSEDEKIFYYIDSLNLRVDAFDYDAETSEISNRRTIFSLVENQIDAFPDGMTIDTDGNLWIACYQGSRVIKIDPSNGSLLSTIPLPVSNITSVAFGGKNLDELYVTSAQYESFQEGNKDDKNAGCVFKVRGTGSKGRPGVSIILNH